MKRNISLFSILAISLSGFAQSVEKVRYGDFENWITRHIPESKLLGGKTKTVYEIGPTQTIEGAVAYSNKGGSPWATSNVYARVMGINKASNAVNHSRALQSAGNGEYGSACKRFDFLGPHA